jgi:hypothetical protein
MGIVYLGINEYREVLFEVNKMKRVITEDIS